MGGSLSDRRLSRAEFVEYLNVVWPRLDSVLKGIEYRMVPYYRMKEDFGDVDFVVNANAGDLVDAVNNEFDPDNLVINDGILSFTSGGFQIDLICTIMHYHTSLAFFSWNDLGNILGRMFHRLGLKFGHEGLLYPLRDDRGGLRKEIVVSTDMQQIIEFLGCDYSKWMSGFDNLDDIFKFVVASQYFSTYAYDVETSAIIRKRDKKRNTINKFLIWMETNKPKDNHTYTSRSDKDKYVPGIDAYFGTSIKYQKEQLIIRLAIESEFKKKFSGDLLMMLVPLVGFGLGRFIGQYKKHMINLSIGGELTNYHNIQFENVIMTMEQNDINKSIMNFYDGISK